MAKHLNEEFEKLKNWEDHLADSITAFCGTMLFVYIHLAWFGMWILINLGLFKAFIPIFDPFPFGLLTLIVSLEAIFLSTFVMISQNRTARQDELRAQLDYETNVRAEKEVKEIITLLKDIHGAVVMPNTGTGDYKLVFERIEKGFEQLDKLTQEDTVEEIQKEEIDIKERT